MSQPTAKSVHRDAHLTNISIMHKPQMFVSERVFPNVPVKKQSDYYYVFKKGAWFRLEANRVAPAAEPNFSGYVVSDAQYMAAKYGLGTYVPIEVIRNADNPLNPLESGARFVTNGVLLRKEYNAASTILAGSVFTNEEDAEGGWVGTTDGSGNTFIADVLKAKEAIRKLIGRYPNVFLLDAGTFNQVKQEYTVLERIKYTGTQGRPADVTAQTLAQLFELEEVLIGGAIYSDAEEVAAGTDFNAVNMWEKNATKGSALLFYRPSGPSLEEPAMGYAFNWKGDEGAQNVAQQDVYRTVYRWWEDKKDAWGLKCQEYFDIKVTSADAGYLFTDTIAT